MNPLLTLQKLTHHSPIQVVILKLLMGEPLDDRKPFPVRLSLDVGHTYQFTEKSYTDYLSGAGMMAGDLGGRTISIAMGRQSGKTLLGYLLACYGYNELDLQVGNFHLNRDMFYQKRLPPLPSLALFMSPGYEFTFEEVQRHLDMERQQSDLLDLDLAIVQEFAYAPERNRDLLARMGALLPTGRLISFTSPPIQRMMGFHSKADFQLQIPAWHCINWVPTAELRQRRNRTGATQFLMENAACI